MSPDDDVDAALVSALVVVGDDEHAANATAAVNAIQWCLIRGSLLGRGDYTSGPGVIR